MPTRTSRPASARRTTCSAIKFNIGRYLSPATNDTIYTANTPANRIVTTVARNWTDGNHNFVVDCDLLNPAAQSTPGGDTCAALTGEQLNFGKPAANATTVNPAVLNGWGVRPDDWQWGLNLQQQLAPRVSLEVGYNRRWWGNFTVTDNLALAPSDYQKWTINAPVDPRLPNGGGYPVDVYTLTQAASARPGQNFITKETDFGPARTNYWQGVDVTVNARTRQGLTLQVGTTTGRAITDTCATSVLIDSPDPRNCRSVDPYETTTRGSASYTVPKVDILVSATVRRQPPPPSSCRTRPCRVCSAVCLPAAPPAATRRCSCSTPAPTGYMSTITGRRSTCASRRFSGSRAAAPTSAST
jgi:hypothetical protein